MDIWEKVKIIITIMSAIIIPIVIAIVGHNFTQAIKERELQGRFVELAFKILDQPPDDKKTALRKWAVDVINNYSGVQMDKETQKYLWEKGSLVGETIFPIDKDPAHLHPALRKKVEIVLKKLASEGIPFRVFEGFRFPQRQKYMFEQGRTKTGTVITNAGPWDSYHQYGLAVSFVLYENGMWSWDDSGKRNLWWNRLKKIGEEEGLIMLTWSKTTLLLGSIDIKDLKSGRYPSGGDLDWAENLKLAIDSWKGEPPAPPAPKIND